MEEEFKLSGKLLKTLTAETRKEILKALEKRPMTASELSRRLGKHVTTISEHLERLKESELVERVERPGRKWIYYRLTYTGKKILHPRSYRWIIVFTFSFLCVIGLYTAAQKSAPWIYPLDQSLEKLYIMMTVDPAKKAERHMQYAEERLEEAKAAVEMGDVETVRERLREYRKEMMHAKRELDRAKVERKNIRAALERISESTAKQAMILKNIESRLPYLRGEIQPLLNISESEHAMAVGELERTFTK